MKFKNSGKKYIFIVILLGLPFLLISSQSYSQEPASLTPDAYANLKAQIKKELHKEIKDELYTEMSADIQVLVQHQVQVQWESYLAENVGQLWEQHAQATKDFNFAHQPRIYKGETLDNAVGRMVREVFESGEFRRYISDSDLDDIVAGAGIPRPVSMASGYQKHPTRSSFELAKSAANQGKVNKRKLKDSDENWLMVGGEEQPASIERTLVQKGSVLLPKGQLQAEPSTTWSHFSSSNININGFAILDILVIGTIQTQKIKRDIFIQNFALKYGLLDNLQAEVKVPFRAQYSRDTISQTSETSNSKAGLGDIEIGLSRQIAWEEGWMPDLIAAVNFKSRTGKSPYGRSIGLGTGHYAMRGTLIAAKASDPAVIFASLSYTQNFERNISGIGDVNPGESIGYSLGMAIALSYQTAINFSFEHSLTDKLRVDGDMVNGSLLNSASVKIGANWAFNEKSSMDFGVAFGVTDDAPDVTVDVRFPFLF